MNNFKGWSIVCLGGFAILFWLLFNDGLALSFGKVALVFMLVLPLLGIFFGAKSANGLLKWVLIVLHVLAFCSIAYLLLLGFGMGEA